MSDPAPLTDTTCEHGRPDHQVLIRQLAEALGLDLPALPETPRSVWHRLLTEVEQARSQRDEWKRVAVATGGVDRLEQFWSRVEKSDGCWLWTGHLGTDGYGKLNWSGRTKRAHRVAYELSVGPIPEGLQLDHLCRVPACVNPGHLEPVTHQENMRRGLHGKLTTHCPQGHPYDDDNTYCPPGTDQQRCRTCLREHSARYRERVKAKRATTERSDHG